MKEKFDTIMSAVNIICEENKIMVHNELGWKPGNQFLIFKRDDRGCMFNLSIDNLENRTTDDIIHEIDYNLKEYIINFEPIPNTSEELFDKIICNLRTLCVDNGIGLKYHYDIDKKICTFKFIKYGKVFRYAVNADDILQLKPDVINYAINSIINDMYYSAINEIG